ncbi:hypothetical protein PR048_011125 [Dryococelus australis]|uniref:Uncharacterized protein n=1 Tax=Dryococelus australis TaxID=614101 RepID=A0ABQ9HKP8_9NEOP|nr:hypothetical protein PR048_011125 [Dryococelus australis]
MKYWQVISFVNFHCQNTSNKHQHLKKMRGYVTCSYEEQWWLASVFLKGICHGGTMKLKFLHPEGPTP